MIFVPRDKQAMMAIQHTQLGNPNQNALSNDLIEPTGKRYLFNNLRDVKDAAYWWRLEYNEERPHDSLNDHTPLEARQKAAANSNYEPSY